MDKSETKDINQKFNQLLKDIDIDPNELDGKMNFLGQDPIIPSISHAGEISALTRALPSYLSALIWQKKTGRGQDVTVDLRKSIYEMSPFFKGAKAATIAGVPARHSPLYGAEITKMFKTKDDRWFMPTGMYPKAFQRMMNLLNCNPDPKTFEKSIKEWNAEELEQAFDENDLPGIMIRTPEEYERQEQTKYIKDVPLIKITKIKDGSKIPFQPSERPLSDVKVLGLTHVLAGPAVLRTFAEQGANCLNLWGKDSFEQPSMYSLADTGMRSAFIDLLSKPEKQKFINLIKDADVFVENLHGDLLEKLGITPDDIVSESDKGLIYVSMRCYGHSGPKASLPGFDMHAVANSGFCTLEGTEDRPQLPYTAVFNDFTAGFLGAAGALAALIMRAENGGSYKVEVSLSRCTEFYNSLGFFDKDYVKETVNSDPEHTLGIQDMLYTKTSLGKYVRPRPEVELSETPAYWEGDILVPRGSSNLNW